jgi:hypothetical protein
MAGKFTIVLEGEDDQKFLKDVLSIHFPEQQEIEFILLRNNANELQKYKETLLIYKDVGRKIIIILDADQESYEATKNTVEKYTQEIDPKVFLFPDNKSFGRLETLLRELVPEVNKPLLKCIDGYRTCINGLKDIPLKKFDHHNEIYVYINSLKESDLSKGKEKDYSNNSVWDLRSENPGLKPLLSFLSEQFRPQSQ